MSEAKKEIVRIVSPKGDAIYPKLFVADTKFNADGDYKLDLAVPKADAEAFIESLKSFRAEALSNAKAQCKPEELDKLLEQTPWEEMIDKNTKQPTGKIKFRFKQRAKIKTKKGDIIEVKPTVSDASGAILTVDPGIGNGSQVKVNFTPAPFFTPGQPKKNVPPCYGLSLRLNGVRIIELKKWVKGANADLFGGAEEGYTVGQETNNQSDADNF